MWLNQKAAIDFEIIAVETMEYGTIKAEMIWIGSS